MRRLASSALLVALAVASATSPTQAAARKTLGLADMAHRAGQIFYGECLSRTVKVHAHRPPTITYQFQVLSALKGSREEQVTVNVTSLFSEITQFAVGRRYLVLLYPTSSRGLTSPLGLDQGAFPVSRTQDGKPFVTLRNRRMLLRDVPRAKLALARILDQPGTRVALADLESLIRSLLPKGK